jgi:hypothetical protein
LPAPVDAYGKPLEMRCFRGLSRPQEAQSANSHSAQLAAIRKRLKRL